MFDRLKELYKELEKESPEAAKYFEEQLTIRARCHFNSAAQVHELDIKYEDEKLKKKTKKVKQKNKQ